MERDWPYLAERVVRGLTPLQLRHLKVILKEGDFCEDSESAMAELGGSPLAEFPEVRDQVLLPLVEKNLIQVRNVVGKEHYQLTPSAEVAFNIVKKNRMRDQVFISYSHKDKRSLDALQTHLQPYLRCGPVTAWSDKQITPGSKWFGEIKGALAKTQVAVLLVSPHFLASDFIHEHELGPLLREAESGGVTILWIQIRACAHAETPLKQYQAVVSPPEKPFAEMKAAERDGAWLRVCEEIKKAANP